MRYFIAMVMLIFSVNFMGCATMTPPPEVEVTTTITKDENGNVIGSSHTQIIKGRAHIVPETTRSWAEADQIARDHVDLNQTSVSESVGEEKGAKTAHRVYKKTDRLGGYTGYIRNDDATETLFLEHPDTGQLIAIPPGGIQFIETKRIPKYLYGKWSGKGEKLSFEIRREKIIRAGKTADYGTAPYKRR